MHPSDTRPHSFWLIPILGALVAFAPLSIDMYLSAFPQLARDFPSMQGVAQFSLACYLIGMAVGQIFYGPFSDRCGRKLPLYVGLGVYIAGSVGCALATSPEMLLACRFLQAAGGCAGVVIPMAMVRDMFDQQSSARTLSRLMLVMGVAPILAPWIGSHVLGAWGWRAIFWVLAMYGVLAIAAVHLILPESLAPERRRSVSLAASARAYWHMLSERRFMGYALAAAFSTAGMFAYIAASPTVLIEHYGLSPQHYTWVFGMNACGLIAASQLNHRLLARFTPDRILWVSLGLMAAAGLCLLVAGVSGKAALPALLAALFSFVALLGFISPNTGAGAMAAHGAQAGSASALLGTIRFGISFFAGSAVGAFSDGSALTMGIVIAVCGGAALLSYLLLARAPAAV
ncbi:Bcr/CflA family multidrug efflux MFS transporter [Massilia sp. CF038]|uniref:Bcr/CflA family multidrug efflux MFS transporter n=1 Tax=Massilia sp. CF038 TaxID=1881045 RepID=UPI00091F8657|nr:Bcr/CflA family multidrug efflux MFS transporter [Massilia sp. CF038]SHH30098.1 MFS transporter, DHA1 family, bicyclomycin/chloramphenicol resistance protein [Massilia sp. CF038]